MSELPAGRELDALVAEKVMGMPGGLVRALAMGPQHYSTDIRAAWEVVEKLAASWDVELYRYHELTPPTGWVCKIGELVDGDPVWGATGATAPLAVCRAALKVGSET